MSSIDTAFKFYSRHIFDREKMALLKEHNLQIAGSVPPVLWELFGALLTGRSGFGTTGADLRGWEVKSAKDSGSYEYQYHLNSGAGKLEEDCHINHLFCSYSNLYKDVTVKAMSGSELEDDYFRKWMPKYKINYQSVGSSSKLQRFRKSISYSRVQKKGTPILDIKDGKLTFRDDSQIPLFNRGS